MSTETVLDFAQRDAGTFPEIADRLIDDAMKLPEGERVDALDRALRAIDPMLAGGVLYESRYLIAQGAPPREALRLALIALLVAYRKKQYRMLTNEIVPFQATKIAAGIFVGPGTRKERAARVRRYVASIAASTPRHFDRAFARQRLVELGLTKQEIESILIRRPRTARQYADQLATAIRQGTEPKVAVQQVLADAMRQFVLYTFMSSETWRTGSVTWRQPEPGDEQDAALGCVCVAVIGAIVSAASVAASIAVPLAQQAHADRNARRAQRRQQQTALSQGEVDQVVAGVLRSGATTWGAQQEQAALDYIRVNRFGRTRFVEPEQRSLQTAFNNARAAIVAQQEAARRAQERKTLIGVGIGVVALVGGAFLLKKSRS